MTLRSELLKALKDDGWTLVRHGKHETWMLGSQQLVTSKTPSDHRALKNALATARRLRRIELGEPIIEREPVAVPHHGSKEVAVERQRSATVECVICKREVSWRKSLDVGRGRACRHHKGV